MLSLTFTTVVLYVILGCIIGWFARALYDLERLKLGVEASWKRGPRAPVQARSFAPDENASFFAGTISEMSILPVQDDAYQFSADAENAVSPLAQPPLDANDDKGLQLI